MATLRWTLSSSAAVGASEAKVRRFTDDRGITASSLLLAPSGMDKTK